MPYPPRRDYFSPESITVTEDHLKLLRRSCWGWEGGEWGAPAMDTKRPFGNSDVLQDIAETVDPNFNNDADDWYQQYTEDQQADFIALAFDLAIILEIMAHNPTEGIKLGTYTTEADYRSPWTYEGAQTFAKFTENNDHEGERWFFFLPIEGNEEGLASLGKWTETLEEEEFKLSSEPVPESEVDVLVAHSPSGYMNTFNKVTGRLRLPADTDLTETLYKGGIRSLFETEEAN